MSLDIDYKGVPWVKNISRPNEVSRGLQDRHIAVWQSHGNYFKNDKNEWGWQRPRLFCTTEDLFTQSFVLPYVIPIDRKSTRLNSSHQPQSRMPSSA